jgi:AcrR family transcriptional regulator
VSQGWGIEADAMIESKTKRSESILNMALKLFNELGSHKVTTNHIAEAMGISTGNLYYYYKNKEHIIRELLARLIKAFDALVDIQTGGPSALDLVARTIAATAELIYTYRFIYIELAALLARDEKFKAMYHDIKERRAGEFVWLFDFLAQMGVFRQDLSPEERDAIIFIMWTYVEGIITALHTSNIQVTPASVHTHLKKIVYISKAYLPPDLWFKLAQKLDLSESA